jgi:hypothetical protein
MLKLIVVYLHLLATCAAVGLVLAADLKMLGKIGQRLRSRRAGGRIEPLRLAPPGEFVTGVVAVALGVLLVTGVLLVGFALDERADALANGKLLAKMGLVVVLTLNAVALHHVTFPRLARAEGLRLRGRAEVAAMAWRIALPVAISTGLWAYCAFLGVARSWNHAVGADEVLAGAAAVVLFLWLALTALLAVAASPQRSRVVPVRTVQPPAGARPGTL